MMPLVNQIDSSLMALTLQLPGSWRPVMEAASLIGQPVLMAGLLGGVALLGAKRRHPAIVKASLLGVVGIGLGNLLKLAWQRARPVTYEPLLLHSYSFPSGHALGSAIALGLVGYLAVRHLPGRRGWAALAACLALTLLIGVSRVYLGAHYPTDVLGGWILALAIVAGIIAVARK